VAHPFCDDLPSWVKRVQAVAYVRELETITIWEVMVICRSGTVGRFPSVVWAGPAVLGDLVVVLTVVTSSGDSVGRGWIEEGLPR
jgi:hypothetical protein